MNRNDLFPSRFIKASDLQGREWPVTISHVAMEQLQTQGGKETKGIVYFHAYEKQLVLNQVNYNTIAEPYGEDTDNWGGRPIVLYPTRTQFGTKMVDCIRIKIPANRPATQPPVGPSRPVRDDLDAANDLLNAAGDADDDVPFDLPD